MNLCPFCGAYSPRACELLEMTEGDCLWDLSGDYKSEPDPDDLREQRDEQRRIDRDMFARSNLDG